MYKFFETQKHLYNAGIYTKWMTMSAANVVTTAPTIGGAALKIGFSLYSGIQTFKEINGNAQLGRAVMSYIPKAKAEISTTAKAFNKALDTFVDHPGKVLAGIETGMLALNKEPVVQFGGGIFKGLVEAAKVIGYGGLALAETVKAVPTFFKELNNPVKFNPEQDDSGRVMNHRIEQLEEMNVKLDYDRETYGPHNRSEQEVINAYNDAVEFNEWVVIEDAHKHIEPAGEISVPFSIGSLD
ncbi:MAG: hypothetical protein K0R02_1004 [Rickettsiaceae bacterium]|jgi:hypothetical protein|nr:hypothetical protein [Rickettsiaceae bacterium]